MSESAYIFNVDQDNFSDIVLNKSQELPVVVDFWAAWCAPCRMLMPLLDKLANEYAGQFILAKVNSDEQQQLAAQYGVRSLPTVKIFKGGAVVDEFMGAQPEPAIREILDRHIERESDKLLMQAQAALDSADVDKAEQLLAQAAEMDPQNHLVNVALAGFKLQAGDTQTANEMLRALPTDMQDKPEVKRLRAQSEFAAAVADAPDAASLEQQLATDPGDLRARYQLAVRKVLAGDYPGGLEQLLAIMKQDRKFEDDAGRRGMLSVFEMLGNTGELVNEYRRKMAAVLY